MWSFAIRFGCRDDFSLQANNTGGTVKAAASYPIVSWDRSGNIPAYDSSCSRAAGSTPTTWESCKVCVTYRQLPQDQDQHSGLQMKLAKKKRSQSSGMKDPEYCHLSKLSKSRKRVGEKRDWLDHFPSKKLNLERLTFNYWLIEPFWKGQQRVKATLRQRGNEKQDDSFPVIFHS